MSQEESPDKKHADLRAGSRSITVGDGPDSIGIGYVGAIVVIAVGEDVRGPTIIEAAAQAIKASVIAPRIPVLIDMTKFAGIVDWGAIHTVRGMAGWAPGGEAAARVAVLVRDETFGSLVTLAGALFPRAARQLFIDHEAALAWLSTPRTA